MRILSVGIQKEVVFKIYKKHGIKFTEVKTVLLNNSYVAKTKQGRYIAIGKSQRFVTVIFGCVDGCAEIVTAYPSADWQVRLYKSKREK